MMAKGSHTIDEARFARFSTDYACHNTIQHWQLRDLIEYDDATNIIYTACGAKIVGFNLRTRTVLDVVPAPPRGHRAPTGPTTFAVKDGYLATGTDKGELSVYDMEPDGSLKSKPRFQSTITRQNEVLNNLNIISGKQGGQRPRLYTCGNDRTVRSYSIDTMQCLEEIKCGYIPILLLLAASVTRLAIVMYSSLVGIRDFAHIKRQPVAVNCSAEDPSGNRLITLGDDSVVRLYCRDQTGTLRESTQLWADSTDRVNACGMCCHWHPWGNTFATAFQCGQLLVWDARSKQRVAQLRTQGRAIRSVKYSSEPNDLLAFGEHEQAFHLVDARNYAARQTLHVSVSSVGISGMAFDATASRLFVGVDCKGFQEWSIDSAARRSFCSSSSA